MLRKDFLCALNYVNLYRNSTGVMKQMVNFKSPRKVLLSVRSLSIAASETKSTSSRPSYIESIKSYFHQYLLERPEYYRSIFNINCLKTVNESDPESLKLLGHVINSSSPITTVQDKLEESFKSELNAFTVKEICKSIYFLSQLGILDEKTPCRNLLVILENELQLRKFSKEEYLMLLYALHTTCTFKRSYLEFLKKKSCIKLSCKLHKLSPQQAVEFFYCMNQDFSKVKYKYGILSTVNDMIPQFNSDELGIIAFGLFKSKIINSHNNIGNNLIKKTLQEIQNIHPYALFMIIKVLKKFLLPSNVPELFEFQEQMIPHLKKLKPIIAMDIAEIGSSKRALNLTFWESAKNLFQENIEELGVLALLRLLQIQVCYNIYDEEFLNLIVKNLEDKFTSEKYSLLLSLSHLTHFRIFPKKLLDLILTKDFALSLMKRNTSHSLKLKFWYLNCCVELDKPEYCFKLFDDFSRAQFYKHAFYGFSSCKNVQRLNAFFYTARNVLVNLFGTSMVYKTNCVPYFEYGCVMRFDKDFNAQPIPEEFILIKNYYAQEALKDDHFWLFIMFCTKNDFLWNSDTICLPRQTQYRHLKLLGFTPVVIIKEIFFQQLNIQKQEDYMKELINASLKQIKSGKSC